MDNNELLVQYEKRRIFIDIAFKGCGSGCVYCYSDSSSDKQSLISLYHVDKLCQSVLEKLDDSIYYIISFCPNTEPFKSDESCNLIIRIIKKLRHKKVAFQIATKEFIPLNVLKTLNELSRFKNQIFINISMPYLETKIIEPHAGTCEERIRNIQNIKDFSNLSSCLYIKPYNSFVKNNIDKYIKLIREEKPDYVCVGMKFEEKLTSNSTCRTMYTKEIAEKTISKNDFIGILKIKEELEKEGVLVYFASTCFIVNCLMIECEQELYKYKPEFCQKCVIRRIGDEKEY
ncbi:hypothetical protein [[Clostridium] polysaccharolyticum]|uniref:DNA repair photolyase n=1 Tax=[Clostridium] polysaccharolyticum TaxID=29364 RepID=A0A1I0FT17_9FIRM|nr:hypothetical protein [[Clostridium] polysaccharolyticum]SET61480.1 hypothetical protein SAMN04487772_13721 [[Clostridium] polysaccharolyticum]